MVTAESVATQAENIRTVDAGIATALKGSLPAINTPESLGWTLVNYVLSEGVTNGTVNGDKIEVPVTVTISAPPAMFDESHDVVTELCITVLGHSLACMQVHIHTTVGA